MEDTNITFLDIIHCSIFYLKNMTYQRLDSVSVFRWNLFVGPVERASLRLRTIPLSQTYRSYL
jgi:hypothetical protein